MSRSLATHHCETFVSLDCLLRQRYRDVTVDEPAWVRVRARLAFHSRAKVTALPQTGPHPAPGWCLPGESVRVPHHDAPRRARPAPRLSPVRRAGRSTVQHAEPPDPALPESPIAAEVIPQLAAAGGGPAPAYR